MATDKTLTQTGRNGSPKVYNPWDRFLRNDLLDFWDGDTIADTIPSMNISEENEQYKVEMAAPGLKKEDFDIVVDENVVTISCDKEQAIIKEGNEKSRNGYSRREYNYSDFSRSFTIPDNADTNGIVAKYNDGILTLTIPKKKEAKKDKSQKVTVQ